MLVEDVIDVSASVVIVFGDLYAHYIPETNHVSRVHSVAAVVCLQFLLHVMLYRP